MPLCPRRLGALLFALMLCVGCSRGSLRREEVRGEVKFNNQPLAAGVIRLVPADGLQAPAVQAAVRNGQFAFTQTDGPLAGNYRVEVEAAWSFALDDELAYAKFASTHRGRPPVNAIPAQFNRESTLTAEVPVGGTESLSFDLRAGSGRR